MQTPYVYPQVNGNRAGVRWLTLLDDNGRGLRVEGDPLIDVSLHRWTAEAILLPATPLTSGRGTPSGLILITARMAWDRLHVARASCRNTSCRRGRRRSQCASACTSVLIEKFLSF